MRCLTCHYDLRHLTEHRCPECGRAFNPLDRSTYQLTPTYGLRRALVLVAISYILAFLAFLWWSRDMRNSVDVIQVPGLVIASAILAIVYLPISFVIVLAGYSVWRRLCGSSHSTPDN